MKHLRHLRGVEALERRELPANNLFSAPAPAKIADDSSQTALIDSRAASAAAAPTPPTITLGGATSHYVENAAPVVLAPGATFAFGDAQLPYARLTVTLAGNGTADDRIALRVSPAGINISGKNVHNGQRVIGHLQTGPTAQLTVQFTRFATRSDVEALLRSVTFRTLGDNPLAATRTVQFQLRDINGLASNTPVKQVVVQAVNDLPRVIISGSQTFQAGQAPVVLAPDATLVDPDSPDYSGGQLLVSVAKNIQPGDNLYIRSEGNGLGQISAANKRVYFEHRLIGTYFGGWIGQSLSVRFLSGASPQAVQQVLRNITFAASGNPLSTVQRSITFEISDRFAPEMRQYKVVDGVSFHLGIVKPPLWKATDHRPALVFVGSTWTVQSPNWWNERMAYFASRGIVCIRTAGRTVPLDQPVPPEAPAQDVKSAMRWIRAHAAELGIDPNRIGVLGASAGAHLAAVGAMIDGLNDPNDDLSVSAKANALIMFNGIVDTGPDGGWGYNRIAARYREFSPAENVSSDDPPTFNVSGTADNSMAVETVRRFQARLQAAGVRTDFHYYQDAAHGFMNHTAHNGRYFYWTLVEADRFLASLGWLHGLPTALRPAADRIATGLTLPWYAGMKTVSVQG